MIKAKKVRLLPTKEQEEKFFKCSNIARFSYNYSLGLRIRYYKMFKKTISEQRLRKHITKRKKTKLKFLSEVSNDIPKQAVKDMNLAFKNFFQKGNKGFPRFKSKRKSKLSFYNDVCKLKIEDNNIIQLAKMGKIKTSEQLPINTKFTNPRISYDGKYWYISIGVEVDENQVSLNKDLVIGIDLGLKNLALCSDNSIFKNINKTHKVRKTEKRLKRLQRKVSRKYDVNKQDNKYLKTKNILKLEKEIKLIHRKLTNMRNNHLHQTTNSIVKKYPYKIVMEDLNVSEMMKNIYLSKAVANQGFFEFTRQMEYKCKFNGIEFVKADRFYPSSKKCSQCGCIKKNLKLSDRIYKCECGLEIDRDLNASINLANYEKLA
ncbi:RNA-guided endonuclease InsQ/TnpB family protein [Clostridioides difficile]